MFGVPNPLSWLSSVGIVMGVAAVVGLIAYTKGSLDGRASERVNVVNAALEQIQERSENNEAVRDLNACDLIVELGGVPNGCTD